MKGLTINGSKLHEVRMKLEPYSQGTVSYLVYPKSRINYQIYDDLIQLKIPSKLAVELYRTSVFPQGETESFEVHLSGKTQGRYKIVKLIYPQGHSEDVTFFLHKQ
ncbi:hypothetical protein JQC92_16830 [Shewanella sp. 202IG2-18]|uniref:hypothetical protein n=1 Tax=Parashewanella hymeniacidonis TaxID=2807618 RepID=UPI001961F86E|nr:hypothetical protein [Parashewanella hymeniacidonis]MBM7073676.1 hypothetical protein [Parashewanella hymeniacidonis]